MSEAGDCLAVDVRTLHDASLSSDFRQHLRNRFGEIGARRQCPASTRSAPGTEHAHVRTAPMSEQPSPRRLTLEVQQMHGPRTTCQAVHLSGRDDRAECLNIATRVGPQRNRPARPKHHLHGVMAVRHMVTGGALEGCPTRADGGRTGPRIVVTVSGVHGH